MCGGLYGLTSACRLQASRYGSGPWRRIELDQLTKVYADGTRAVHELDLEIADGEFVVFVGPSGCGKTSALRMVAGLEDITDGDGAHRRARSSTSCRRRPATWR